MGPGYPRGQAVDGIVEFRLRVDPRRVDALGNVAVRSGQAIEYNPETGEIAGSSSASQYLKPYIRKGWEI